MKAHSLLGGLIQPFGMADDYWHVVPLQSLDAFDDKGARAQCNVVGLARHAPEGEDEDNGLYMVRVGGVWLPLDTFSSVKEWEAEALKQCKADIETERYERRMGEAFV
jgi:hypothetical protein